MSLVSNAEANVRWRKSSHSAGDGGECVEVAAMASAVLVRDSKAPDGPRIHVTSGAWDGLVRRVAG